MSRPHQRENAMKMSLCTALCAAALMLAAGAASADSWKNESGKGRWRGDYGWGDSERKFKYRIADGCEVERKWKKGEYEEKVSASPAATATDTDPHYPSLAGRSMPSKARAPSCESATAAIGRYC